MTTESHSTELSTFDRGDRPLTAAERAERRIRPLPVNPRVSAVVTTDGRRDYLPQMLTSLHDHVHGGFQELIVVDDSGDTNYRDWVAELIEPHAGVLIHHEERQGQTAAINDAWARIDRTRSDYFVHLEDDFVFESDIDLAEWAYPLTLDPALAQVTLLRQPWSVDELEAGSVLERTPGAFTERRWGGVSWLEHRRGYFANPHIAPIWVADHRWPDNSSEPGFSTMLLVPPPEAEIPATIHFAYFGRLGDPPRITHIGDDRSAGWCW